MLARVTAGGGIGCLVAFAMCIATVVGGVQVTSGGVLHAVRFGIMMAFAFVLPVSSALGLWGSQRRSPPFVVNAVLLITWVLVMIAGVFVLTAAGGRSRM